MYITSLSKFQTFRKIVVLSPLGSGLTLIDLQGKDIMMFRSVGICSLNKS